MGSLLFAVWQTVIYTFNSRIDDPFAAVSSEYFDIKNFHDIEDYMTFFEESVDGFQLSTLDRAFSLYDNVEYRSWGDITFNQLITENLLLLLQFFTAIACSKNFENAFQEAIELVLKSYGNFENFRGENESKREENFICQSGFPKKELVKDFFNWIRKYGKNKNLNFSPLEKLSEILYPSRNWKNSYVRTSKPMEQCGCIKEIKTEL